MKLIQLNKSKLEHDQKQFLTLQSKSKRNVSIKLNKRPYFDFKTKMSSFYQRQQKQKQKRYKSLHNRGRLLQVNSFEPQKRIFLYKEISRQAIQNKQMKQKQNIISNYNSQSMQQKQVIKKSKSQWKDRMNQIYKRRFSNIKYWNKTSSIGTIIRLQNQKFIGHKKKIKKKRFIQQYTQLCQSVQKSSLYKDKSLQNQNSLAIQTLFKSQYCQDSLLSMNNQSLSAKMQQIKQQQDIIQSTKPIYPKNIQSQQTVICLHRHVIRAKIIDRLILLKNQFYLLQYYDKVALKLCPFIDQSFQINQKTISLQIKYSLFRLNYKPALKFTNDFKITAKYYLFKLAFSLNTLLSINPNAISDLFQQSFSNIENRQLYSFWLCIEGQFKPVIVDDILIQQRQGVPLFCWCGRNQLWPMLLQKGLAKCFKSYKQLDRLQPYQLLKILTGSPCFTRQLNKSNFGIDSIQKLLLDEALIIFKSKIIGIYLITVINIQYPYHKQLKQCEGQYLKLKYITKVHYQSKIKTICNLITQKGQTINAQYHDLVKSTQIASFNFIHTNYYYHYQKVQIKKGKSYVLNFSTNDNHVYIDLLSTVNQIRLKMQLYQQVNWNRQKSQLKFISQTSSTHSRQIFINKILESGQYNLFFQSFSHSPLNSFSKKSKKQHVNQIVQQSQVAVISLYSQKQLHVKKVKPLQVKSNGIHNYNTQFYVVSAKNVIQELKGFKLDQYKSEQKGKFEQVIEQQRKQQNSIQQESYKQYQKQTKRSYSNILKTIKKKKLHKFNKISIRKFLID